MKIRIVIFLLLSILCNSSFAQQTVKDEKYWNRNTQLLPWRMQPVISSVTYIDLDKDGDPDILKAIINSNIPITWIDDDDDMRNGDKEGDTDNDCLLIDKNKDGIFAGPHDLSIDWSDEDNDGKADVQLIVSNGGTKLRNYFDWGGDFMYIMDVDKDKIMHYVDWNKIMMQAWEHNGHANFFYDYTGNSTFLKMHASSFRINDLRFNWENPFIFYDTDGDKLTEWAIRLVDTPHFRDSTDRKKYGFDKIDTAYDVDFTKRIDYAALTWDLDNDNAAGNEFDFDMSLLFKGKGFSYADQVHKFKGLKGLKAANDILYDKRWREIDELYYADRDTAYQLTMKGDWQQCRLVFDEDDDCNRWERVEFYDPLDLFIIGTEKGGLDNNKQADALGDRGEFDMDYSGKGQLYIGRFDGKIHLYGAEWGAWRIDQTAFSFQGFGGQYDRWGRNRLQREQEKFATVKYTDTNNNGFIDVIEYDLDGDKQFEEKISLTDLGIDDANAIIKIDRFQYKNFNQLFTKVANEMWSKAQLVLSVAKKNQINTDWYAFYQQPHSLHEKYDYGYWLMFYLYRDMRHAALVEGNTVKVTILDKAYYSGDWSKLLK